MSVLQREALRGGDADVRMNLQDVASLLAHLGVELVVPGGEQAVGDIQPLPIQTAIKDVSTILMIGADVVVP